MRGGRDQSRFQSLLYWISHCGLYGEAAMVDEWIGFNPCCIGLAIAANRYRATQTEGCRRFNPCCIGLAIAAPCSAQRHSDCCSFNPCCIGLAIAAAIRKGAGQRASHSFHPCCIGLAIAAGHYQRRIQAVRYCFNPCCIGLAIAALVQRLPILRLQAFQSLLYWISHCGIPCYCVAPAGYAFQSLLYWISHCGGAGFFCWRKSDEVSILVVLD